MNSHHRGAHVFDGRVRISYVYLPSRTYRAVAMLLLLTLLAANAMQSARADSLANDAIGNVLAAWRSRQDSTKSLAIAWTERLLIPKGPAGTHRTAPADDLKLSGMCRLYLLDDKMRYERSGQLFDPEDRSTQNVEYIGRYNGERFAAFFPKSESGFPFASVAKSCDDARNKYIYPVLLIYRGLQAGNWAIDPRDTRVDIEPIVVNGRTTHRVIRVANGNELVVYVDPSMAFFPVRAVLRRLGEAASIEFDIQYLSGNDGNPLPRSWSVTDVDQNGNLSQRCEAHVDHVDVNSVTDASLFDLAFPVGTWVTDQTNDGITYYIVRPGGGRRVILPEELGAENYERLLRTETGGAIIGAEVSSWQGWTFVAAGALVAVVSVILMWMRRKTRLQVR